jgi:RNase P/RNase MRP subunit p29
VNVVGKKLKVLTTPDPTKAGLAGTAVLETANTLLIQRGTRRFTVEKRGSAFLLTDSGTVLTGTDLDGRLEDRWGRRN